MLVLSRLCFSRLSGNQNGLRWSQDGSKMASRAPKMAQEGPSDCSPILPDLPPISPRTTPMTPRGPKLARSSPSGTQDGPKWLQDGFKRSPKWSTGASKIALSPRHRANFIEFACPFLFCVFRVFPAIKVVQDGPKIAPRWHQERSRGPQGGP